MFTWYGPEAGAGRQLRRYPVRPRLMLAPGRLFMKPPKRWRPSSILPCRAPWAERDAHAVVERRAEAAAGHDQHAGGLAAPWARTHRRCGRCRRPCRARRTASGAVARRWVSTASIVTSRRACRARWRRPRIASAIRRRSPPSDTAPSSSATACRGRGCCTAARARSLRSPRTRFDPAEPPAESARPLRVRVDADDVRVIGGRPGVVRGRRLEVLALVGEVDREPGAGVARSSRASPRPAPAAAIWLVGLSGAPNSTRRGRCDRTGGENSRAMPAGSRFGQVRPRRAGSSTRRRTIFTPGTAKASWPS